MPTTVVINYRAKVYHRRGFSQPYTKQQESLEIVVKSQNLDVSTGISGTLGSGMVGGKWRGRGGGCGEGVKGDEIMKDERERGVEGSHASES